MTEWLAKRGNGTLVFLSVLALVALASWLGVRATPVAGNDSLDDYPDLFVDAVECPKRNDALKSGRTSEDFARRRADRYAYDPRDGVRAVHGYREAESCYRAAGDERAAQRARRAIGALTARVNTDYAASRLNLLNALEQERWSAALGEIRRLLLLTEHIGRHEYVEWLRKIIGRVAAKASTES